jgi:hypothetical protein
MKKRFSSLLALQTNGLSALAPPNATWTPSHEQRKAAPFGFARKNDGESATLADAPGRAIFAGISRTQG